MILNNKKILLGMVLCFYYNLIPTDIIKRESEYTVIFLQPNAEIKYYRFKAKSGEITILINAAKAAAYSSDYTLDEKIEKYEESMPFIKIIDEDGVVLYETNIYKGYRLIATLINAYLNDSDPNIKEQKLGVVNKRMRKN